MASSTNNQRARSTSTTGQRESILRHGHPSTSIPSAPDASNQTTSSDNDNNYFDSSNALGLDPSILFAPQAVYATSTTNPASASTGNPDNLYTSSSTNFFAPDQQELSSIPPNLANQSFLQPASLAQHHQHQQHLAQYQQTLAATQSTSSSASALDSQLYSSTGSAQQQPVQASYGDFVFDPALESTLLDPTSQTQDFPQSSNDLLNQQNMSELHSSNPQPPHLLRPGLNIHSNHSSPVAQQNSTFGSPGQPNHSRNTSLDPASAAYPQNQQGGEWTTFGTHRRTPSDQHSDVSSSAQPSPYLDQPDSFDQGQSPSMAGQRDHGPLPDAFSLTFSLTDRGQPDPNAYSPGHSNGQSPAMPLQYSIPQFTGTDDFGLLAGDETFDADTSLFPTISEPTNDPTGTTSPPEISIHPPEPSRNAPFVSLPQDMNRNDTLSPPDLNYRRRRASSETYARPASGTINARSRSPSVGGLLPSSAGSRSRSPSPVAPANGVNKDHIRRSSSPSFSTTPQNAQYIANVVESHTSPDLPQEGFESTSPRSGASPSGSSTGRARVQRHPATFQCTLCPKRFTRAYNLRSHLRTHTDERPFVCTICGKAFARQHDRKRHEGLHTGEKKFVCKGNLASGSGTWGCGRRFARADALGRHFRSEAGRACIKPLLDEEARNHGNAMMNQANQDMLNASHAHLSGSGMLQAPQTILPGQGMAATPLDFGGVQLPAVLLEQYPALADIRWGADAGVGSSSAAASFDDGADDADYDHSGRSSFDTGRSQEFYNEDEDTGYVSGPGLEGNYASGSQWPGVGMSAHNGWASDVGEQF